MIMTVIARKLSSEQQEQVEIFTVEKRETPDGKTVEVLKPSGRYTRNDLLRDRQMLERQLAEIDEILKAIDGQLPPKQATGR